ncbi:hypothetical protein ACIQC5_22435 [Paenarthrobacter sp. NPDC092416]|uniref:hypothetical protein n=1 Tax=Paenarthrobacter sp. NPDC092416 TaxID=3364386 RepID=UPI00380EE9F1
MTAGQRGKFGPQVPRITVEVPVLGVGACPDDYEGLGRFVDALRRPRGLHMTLLHLGILDDLVGDIVAWTKGNTGADEATPEIVSWLRELLVLEGFLGMSNRVITLGNGRVSGLEVDVPQGVHDYQGLLVQGLHVLLDQLGLDNIDDFILSSPALGYRSPRWVPHIAVGQPKTRHQPPIEIAPIPVAFGESRIRNGVLLPMPM